LFCEEDRLVAKVAIGVIFTHYSLRRAFGWYNIRLNDDNLFALGRSESVPQRLGSVTISPELSACRLGTDLNTEGSSNTVNGFEPQDCTNALAAACSWMLYWRRQRLNLDELLPVSQHILEYRQRALCHLNLLDDEGKLETGVQSLLLAKTIEDLDFQSVGMPPRRCLIAPLRLHRCIPTRHSAYGLPTKTGVTKEDQLAKDVLLSARTQNIVGAIVRQLRSSFASSTYVQRHAELSRNIKSNETTKLAKSSSSERQEPNPLKIAAMQKLHDRWPEELLILESRWSSLEAKSGQSIKGRKEKDIYDLLPSNLRAEFESAVQLWASNPDGHITCWNGLDGIGFLACIALALADWDIYGQEAWQLRDDLQYKADRLRKRFVGALQRGSAHRIGLVVGYDGMMRKLHGLSKDVCCNILSKGLYSAPSVNSVTSLLHSREEDTTVYLS
jgi:hypothetical protein